MASSVDLGYCLWQDGMTWSSLLSRQFEGGAATWDGNTSATAVSPLSGVFAGGTAMQVTQAASPAMSVLVNAGYCAVAHLTQGHGVYIFGTLAQETLTVASNSSGQTRTDLILARVYDTANSSSFCDVEIVAGTPGGGQPATPGTSLLLATVTVASGASSILNASITDKRAYTAAPGGILPVTGTAPPVAAGQVVLDGTLQRAASPLTFTQTWSEPGTYTWTMPANTLPPDLQATAGGGGGGGYDGSNNVSGGGAGGGEYAEEPEQGGLSTGNVLTIVVGAAGAASGTGGSAQTAGADTTISHGASVLVHAHGGSAGVNGDGGTAPGGTGSTNTVHFDGGRGGSGDPDGDTGEGGGGGSSAGPGSPGQAGLTGGTPFFGAGGTAVPGGGPGGRGGGDDSDGQPPPYGPGGGGGGTSGAGNSSGAGQAGQAVITWTVQPSTLTALASADTEESTVGTSTGTVGSSGLTPGDSGSSYGWGIGYGSVSGDDTDGTVAYEMQVQFDADGSTDFEVSAKWGLAVPEVALGASGTTSRGQCAIVLLLDGTVLDTLYLRCAYTGGVTYPGDAGTFTYYTSASRGTTPGSGTHTATLAIRTQNSYAGGTGGAHVGNLASTGTATDAFGTVSGTYLAALTAENCYLRVAGIAASAI